MAKRKSGRPRRGKAVTPEMQEQIARMYLRGSSSQAIAGVLGISRHTVEYHLEHNIRPVWRETLKGALEVELAKVAELERVAWLCFEDSRRPTRTLTIKRERGEKAKDCDPKTPSGKKKLLAQLGADMRVVEMALTKVTRSGTPAWLQIIQWCVEFRAKVFGYFQQQNTAEMSDDAPVVQFVEVETREEVEAFINYERFQKNVSGVN